MASNPSMYIIGGQNLTGSLYSEFGLWELVYDGTWHWNSLVAIIQPSPRYGCSMVHYQTATTNCLILFGGRGIHDLVPLNDTWKWEAGQWTQLTPTPSQRVPSPRYNATLTLTDKYAILVGGANSQTKILNDFWFMSYDSPTNQLQWSEYHYSPTHIRTPPPTYRMLSAGSMLHVNITNNIPFSLIGSGFAGELYLYVNDLYWWYSHVWRLTLVDVNSSPDNPQGYGGSVMTTYPNIPNLSDYFGITEAAVIFGGTQQNMNYINDTYVIVPTISSTPSIYFANTYQVQFPALMILPSPRAYAYFTYLDAARGIVMYGGYGFNNEIFSDLWQLTITFDPGLVVFTGVWTQLSTSTPVSPPALYGGTTATFTPS
jgi:hypothetical protein